MFYRSLKTLQNSQIALALNPDAGLPIGSRQIALLHLTDCPACRFRHAPDYSGGWGVEPGYVKLH